MLKTSINLQAIGSIVNHRLYTKKVSNAVISNRLADASTLDNIMASAFMLICSLPADANAYPIACIPTALNCSRSAIRYIRSSPIRTQPDELGAGAWMKSVKHAPKVHSATAARSLDPRHRQRSLVRSETALSDVLRYSFVHFIATEPIGMHKHTQNNYNKLTVPAGKGRSSALRSAYGDKEGRVSWSWRNGSMAKGQSSFRRSESWGLYP